MSQAPRQSRSLSTVHDALHGAVSLRDFDGSRTTDVVRSLLAARVMERLRHVRQLGYTSDTYLSANHSRYAHAVGTMHMMRQLIQGVEKATFAHQPDLTETVWSIFRDSLPRRQKTDRWPLLAQHLLVAGLLQDAGQLPFEESTRYLIEPSTRLQRRVAQRIAFNVSDLPPKAVFTLESVNDCRSKLDGLSLPLLATLITGRLPNNQRTPPALKTLLHMVDGAVDADRLDYVFRDAYGTIGLRGTPRDVVSTLGYYDPRGPVFRDPSSVIEFLTTRARLWSYVYLAPQNRFRSLLLARVLRDVAAAGAQSPLTRLFGLDLRDLEFNDFLALDDESMVSRLKSLKEAGGRHLSNQGERALEMLFGDISEYEWKWIPGPENPADDDDSVEISLPDELYYDTFSSHKGHTLYEARSIRVRSQQYEHLGGTVELEYCSGPFNPLFLSPWSANPMPESILLFQPKKSRDRAGNDWSGVRQAMKAGRLYSRLLLADPYSQFDCPEDTRDAFGFEGPTVFLSYSWLDLRDVNRLVRVLYELKRRYFLLRSNPAGLGRSPATSSVEAVDAADSVIVVVSTNYADRYESDLNGAIHQEVTRISHRREADRIPVQFLALDRYDTLKDRLPWSELSGEPDQPLLTKPLRGAGLEEFRVETSAILALIDRAIN